MASSIRAKEGSSFWPTVCIARLAQGLGQALGVREVQALQSLLQGPEVELHPLAQLPQKSQEVVPDPGTPQLEGVRGLVDSHPRPELHGVQAPLALERLQVGDHEQERRLIRPGQGKLVLPHDPLAEVPHHHPDLGPGEQRGHPVE
jgi:hypothetical protein